MYEVLNMGLCVVVCLITMMMDDGKIDDFILMDGCWRLLLFCLYC
jgi:hypothetical protein